MVPAKPHWVTVRDLLFPGSFAVLSLAFTVWVWVTGAGGEVSGTLGSIMTVITLLCWGAYGWVLWMRFSFLRAFIYIPGPFFAVMVHPGSYQGPLDAPVVLSQFQSTLEAWKAAFEWPAIRDFSDNALFWLWLEPHPIRCNCGEGKLVNGYTVTRSRKMIVGYKTPTQPLSETSLQHEIGHVIQGELTGSWMEAAHHERIRKFGLR